MKGIRIVSYLRRGNYESWCIKIGDLRNHSKADFIEIMNKMIMVMIIISSGIKYRNWSMGNWKLSSEIRQLEFQIAKFRNRNFEELDFNDWNF